MISLSAPTPPIFRAALALVLSAALPAAAATVPNPVAGDVFLAFRASDGQGAESSYLVNLGQDTLFRNAAAGSSFSISTAGDIGADLIATYGSNWATRTDLHWAVFSTRNTASSTVYSTRARSSAAVVTTPWPSLTLDARNGTASQISSVIEGIGGYRGRTATVNSPTGTLQPNSATASSYSYQVATAGTSDFGSLSQWGTIEGTSSQGISSTVLDFYRISGSTTFPVQNLGSFKISGAGIVSFTAVAPVASNVDTDGDGWTDADEVIAGTDPNNASDYFRVQQVVRTANGPTLSFQTVAGRTYQVEYSETLATGSWVSIGSYTATTAQLYQYLDNETARITKPRGFYRVSVSQ